MESFEGHEDRFQYDIFGHSGEADALEFVNHSRPPKNEKARLETIKVINILILQIIVIFSKNDPAWY